MIGLVGGHDTEGVGGGSSSSRETKQNRQRAKQTTVDVRFVTETYGGLARRYGRMHCSISMDG